MPMAVDTAMIFLNPFGVLVAAPEKTLVFCGIACACTEFFSHVYDGAVSHIARAVGNNELRPSMVMRHALRLW